MGINSIVAILLIIFALGFDFTNGFHDAANAIATPVSTRALKPRHALILAAVMNLIGAMLGTAVAMTIAKSIVYLGEDVNTLSDSNPVIVDSEIQLVVIISALIGAIGWNLATWLLGMPSSSSHALIGGLVGAGLSARIYDPQIFIQWEHVIEKVIIPMVACPIIGFVLSYIVMTIFQWMLKRRNPQHIFKTFKKFQIFSAASLALGHGLQDAQKSMGIIFMAAGIAGIGGISQSDADIPVWIKLACASAIAMGTLIGGKRIMKTLGGKMIDIDPAKAFSAEVVSASVLYLAAYVVHAPISTSHTVTSSILGAGATKSVRSVKWGVVKNIVKTWVLTMPGAGLVAFLTFQLLRLAFGL